MVAGQLRSSRWEMDSRRVLDTIRSMEAVDTPFGRSDIARSMPYGVLCHGMTESRPGAAVIPVRGTAVMPSCRYAGPPGTRCVHGNFTCYVARNARQRDTMTHVRSKPQTVDAAGHRPRSERERSQRASGTAALVGRGRADASLDNTVLLPSPPPPTPGPAPIQRNPRTLSA